MRFLTCLSCVLFIAAAADAQHIDAKALKRLDEAPLTVPGAKIATEQQARSLALATFADAQMKAKQGVSSTEGARIDSVATLGFDLDGFGKRGDKIWQASIRELAAGSAVTAIVWIHADTGRARMLISR